MCNLFNLLKNYLGVTPMFYKYTNNFFYYQIFLKLFFNLIARVSFITYKGLHHFDNVIYESFFKLPNFC